MAFLTDLLEHFGITWQDLRARRAPGSFASLKRPASDSGFVTVLDRLKKAIACKEKIVIYGDYDVDGLTATAILKRALDSCGAEVGFFIPSRYVEGYGLHVSRLPQFHEKGYRLLVLVDNGIVANDAILEAKRLGMDVLVVDHHEVGSELPVADGIFHQRINGFLDYNCSAASLCYFLAAELLGRDDPYLAFLAGIAVFSDVMPLQENNLVFAKLALMFLNDRRFQNIANLLSLPASYDDLSFTLIPTLNAPGRIGRDSLSTNWACQFLVRMEDRAYARDKAAFLREMNSKRKELVRQAAFLEGQELSTAGGYCGIYAGLSGLSGLVANREMRKRHVPVAVFCQDEKSPDCLVGSLRSTLPFLSDFLKTQSTLFKHAGGHAKACGVTIDKRDYLKFATLFLSRCEKERLERKEAKEVGAIPIALEDLCQENFDVLKGFEPFGEGFPSPTFEMTVDTASLSYGKSYFQVQDSSRHRRAICFLDPGKVVREKERTTFVGRLTTDSYNGQKTFTLMADDFFQD